MFKVQTFENKEFCIFVSEILLLKLKSLSQVGEHSFTTLNEMDFYDRHAVSLIEW
jgi:hypothetical protein